MSPGNGQSGLAALAMSARARFFRQIVESYLATGEPLGSRNLARILPMSLSAGVGPQRDVGPRTSGFSSSRRIPPPPVYRPNGDCGFFVDGADAGRDLGESDRRSIEAQVAAAGAGRSPESVLTERRRCCPCLTRAAGVVLTTKSNVRLKHIEFVRLERSGACCAGSGGWSGRKPRHHGPNGTSDLGSDEASNLP